MYVVGRVKNINSFFASSNYNPFNLATNEKFHLCSLKIENMFKFSEDKSMHNYEIL